MAAFDPILVFLRASALPEPTPEFAFHPGRGWRFDYAWPDRRLALEVEGGTRKQGGGRHNRPKGYAEDCRKYNAAAVDGWTLLRFTTEMIKKGEHHAALERLLRTRQPDTPPAREPCHERDLCTTTRARGSPGHQDLAALVRLRGLGQLEL